MLSIVHSNRDTELKPIGTVPLGGADHDATTTSSGTGAITGTSGTADSRPEFATVILCEKD